MERHAASRTRPVRIAFLVELDEKSHPVLDAIFRFCYGIWAGRFSLVVPCANGNPLPEFMPWLESFDPDIIYSYVDLDAQSQAALHERLYPSELQGHGTPQDPDRANFRPDLHVEPLTVASILPIATAPKAFDNTRGAQLLGAAGSLEGDRFLGDSFGIPTHTVQNIVRTGSLDSCSMLLAIRPNELEPRRQYVPSNWRTVESSTEALRELAENGRLFSASQLSSMLAHRMDTRLPQWSNSFSIFVGDSIHDRIAFWNVRSFMAPWRDGEHVDLCIPACMLSDASFVQALRLFLNKRNQVSGDSGGSPNRATIRSTSVPESELLAFSQALKEGQSWIAYGTEKLASVLDCVPPPAREQRTGLFSPILTRRVGSSWREHRSLTPSIVLDTPSPEHLRHTPTTLSRSMRGAWAIDLDIERTEDHSPYANVKHRWRMPRRLRVTREFARTYQLSTPHGRPVDARVTLAGFLSLMCEADTVLPKVSLPDDEDAIVTGLTRGRDWHPLKGFGSEKPEQLCYRAARSPAGKHFWGVYQLFGDLNNAAAVLLHGFWRDQFQRLEATEKRTKARRAPVEDSLRKQFLGSSIDTSDPQQLHALSELILREADSLRQTVKSRTWAQLKGDYDAHCARFDERHPAPPGSSSDEEVEWRAGALRNSVQDLCKLGVLHQGYEHRCRRCLHRSWISISALSGRITCEVCGDESPAPVDLPWQFRLNEFLHQSLQRHGVAPLLWALRNYQRMNDDSFWFAGPLNIFFSDEAAESGRPETDIDLTIVENGKVRMCEVKHSSRDVDPHKLANTMLRLRPDFATIAVMEHISPRLSAKFETFKGLLADTGVIPDLLTLDEERDIEDSPYF